MPFYEYECGECGHRVEALQKISDDPLVYCPECNAGSLKKLISAAAFRLKGTGWYETDFKNNSKSDKKEGDKKEGASGSDGDSKPSKKTDAPAAKPASSKSESTSSASA